MLYLLFINCCLCVKPVSMCVCVCVCVSVCVFIHNANKKMSQIMVYGAHAAIMDFRFNHMLLAIHFP